MRFRDGAPCGTPQIPLFQLGGVRLDARPLREREVVGAVPTTQTNRRLA